MWQMWVSRMYLRVHLNIDEYSWGREKNTGKKWREIRTVTERNRRKISSNLSTSGEKTSPKRRRWLASIILCSKYSLVCAHVPCKIYDVITLLYHTECSWKLEKRVVARIIVRRPKTSRAIWYRNVIAWYILQSAWIQGCSEYTCQFSYYLLFKPLAFSQCFLHIGWEDRPITRTWRRELKIVSRSYLPLTLF